jgi:trimethylamine corrinoid protein
MSKDDLIKAAIQAVVAGDDEAAVDVANKVIAEGLNPIEIIAEGFAAGMIKVGDLFAREDYALPEVLLSADAMQKAMDLLDPHIPRQDVKKKRGIVVIGTVQGDIHEIGKRIVGTMLEVYGFEVHDLGADVPIEKFIEKAKELKADILATSALMTTTMTRQKKLEEALREAGIRDSVKTMVGGAAVTQEWADLIGADGYGQDVTEAALKRRVQVIGIFFDFGNPADAFFRHAVCRQVSGDSVAIGNFKNPLHVVEYSVNLLSTAFMTDAAHSETVGVINGSPGVSDVVGGVNQPLLLEPVSVAFLRQLVVGAATDDFAFQAVQRVIIDHFSQRARAKDIALHIVNGFCRDRIGLEPGGDVLDLLRIDIRNHHPGAVLVQLRDDVVTHGTQPLNRHSFSIQTVGTVHPLTASLHGANRSQSRHGCDVAGTA